MSTLVAASGSASATGLVLVIVLAVAALAVYRATRISPRTAVATRPPQRVRRAAPTRELTDAELDAIMAETAAFMARRELWRQAAMVRGKVNFKWGDRIDQLKREGRYEEALELTYECMDASERADAVAGDGNSTWAGWVERACIILRKMGDFDAEERLLQRAVMKLPDRESLVKRLAKATVLAERARQRDARPSDGAEH